MLFSGAVRIDDAEELPVGGSKTSRNEYPRKSTVERNSLMFLLQCCGSWLAGPRALVMQLKPELAIALTWSILG